MKDNAWRPEIGEKVRVVDAHPGTLIFAGKPEFVATIIGIESDKQNSDYCRKVGVDPKEPTYSVHEEGSEKKTTGYWIHIDWIYPIDEHHQPAVGECTCPLMRGCTCGVMESEMTAKGYVRDRFTRSWIKEEV